MWAIASLITWGTLQEGCTVTGNWRPDPHGRFVYRWWDGARWTDLVSDASGTTLTDPIREPSFPITEQGYPATVPNPIVPPAVQPSMPPPHQPPSPIGSSPVYQQPSYSYGQQTSGFNLPGGGPWAAPQQVVLGDASKSPGLAIASLVLGVGAFFFSLIPLFGLLSIPFAIIGVALGIAGIVRAKKGFEGIGLAITGLATSIAALTVSLVYIFAIGTAVNTSVERINTINSDASDGICDTSRFLQDPDC